MFAQRSSNAFFVFGCGSACNPIVCPIRVVRYAAPEHWRLAIEDFVEATLKARCGDFDIICWPFSRLGWRNATAHASCDVYSAWCPCVSDADWCLQSDGMLSSRS